MNYMFEIYPAKTKLYKIKKTKIKTRVKTGVCNESGYLVPCMKSII